MLIVLFFSLFFGIEGLIVGSFLNVVVDRMPHKKSLGGRSSCDLCGRKLTVWELIPVVSFFWQKGKSACCKKKLKWQYPLVEGATGLLFFFTSWFYLTTKALPSAYYLQLKAFPLPHISTILSLAALLLMLMASIAIVITDFRHHVIPDGLQLLIVIGSILFLWIIKRYTLLDVVIGSLLIIGLYLWGEYLASFKKEALVLFYFLLSSLASGVILWLMRTQINTNILQTMDSVGTYVIMFRGMFPFIGRVIEACAVAFPILLLYLITHGEGMGYGDVKLQFGLGLFLGLGTGFLGVYLGFLIGAVYGGALILLKKAGRKSHIAFGPFLLTGAWLAFWLGDYLMQIVRLYFS